MDSHTLELLNLELDDRLDAGGRIELEALLASDPALRTHREQLRGLATLLGDAPVPMFPAGFHAEVMRRAAPKFARRPARRWPSQRTAWAMAASVVVALFGVVLIQNAPPTRPEQLIGTMSPVRMPSAKASVVVEANEPALVLLFRLSEAPAADLVIEFPGDGALVATADRGPAPRVEGRRIVLSAPGSAPLRLRIEGADAAKGFQATLVNGGIRTPVASGQ